jgi:hypothetical protein
MKDKALKELCHGRPLWRDCGRNRRFPLKGVGKIGIVGMNAAIANAVWHATGKRIRKLPIPCRGSSIKGNNHESRRFPCRR